MSHLFSVVLPIFQFLFFLLEKITALFNKIRKLSISLFYKIKCLSKDSFSNAFEYFTEDKFW